jgi:hypothetical protein
MLVIGAGMLLVGFLGAGPALAADDPVGLTGTDLTGASTTGTTTGSTTGSTTGTTTGSTTGTTTGTGLTGTGLTGGLTGSTTGTGLTGTGLTGGLTGGLTSGLTGGLTSGLTGTTTGSSVTETIYYPYDSCSCNYDQWGHRYYDNYTPTTPVYATQVATVPRGGVNTGDGSFGP